MALASHLDSNVASGIVVLAPEGLEQYARVRVRPACAAGLVYRALLPYFCFPLSLFTLQGDDPHILLRGMVILLFCARWLR